MFGFSREKQTPQKILKMIFSKKGKRAKSASSVPAEEAPFFPPERLMFE